MWQWLRGMLSHKPLPLGTRGEAIAAKWLRRRGFEILECNREISDDEADVIALDPDGRTVVIVEVKTRRADDTAPEAALTRTKQFHLSRLAMRLQRSQQYRDCQIRFDVIAVIWPDQGEPIIRHTPGAFEAPW
jgi:putative endonuclease